MAAMMAEHALRFLVRSAALGAALAGLVCVLLEALLVHQYVNAALATAVAVSARLARRPPWYGLSVLGVVAVGLGATSWAPVLLLWGLGMVAECLVRSRDVRHA